MRLNFDSKWNRWNFIPVIRKSLIAQLSDIYNFQMLYKMYMEKMQITSKLLLNQSHEIRPIFTSKGHYSDQFSSEVVLN